MNIFFWTAAIVVFLIVEGLTATLVSIWFSIGSVAALIACVLGANVYVQAMVFILFSAISVFYIRKFARSRKVNTVSRINLDRIIGKEVMVIQTFDDNKSQGIVKINDVQWRVITENGEEIQEGDTVKVADIDGVKLVVRGVNAPDLSERMY